MKSPVNQKVNMNRKTCFALIFVSVLCLLTSACFNIEQEIFLEPDGSGEMVIYFSMPDFPEAVKKKTPGSQQDPQKLIDEFRQKFPTELPSGISLKEVKEIQRHGAIAYYVVLHFNQLSDVDSMIDAFLKNLRKEAKAPSTALKEDFFLKIKQEKDGDLTVITQRFYADIMGAMGGTMGLGKPEGAKAPGDPFPSNPTPSNPTPSDPPPIESEASVKSKSKSAGPKTAAK